MRSSKLVIVKADHAEPPTMAPHWEGRSSWRHATSQPARAPAIRANLARTGSSKLTCRRTARQGRSRRSELRARAGDDALEVHARGQRAVLQAAVAAQSRGAEGIGHGRRPIADEQRALQAQGHR